MSKTQQVYTPKEYEGYIDSLCLKLVFDLKQGVITEKIFIDTYAKYQKLKIENAEKYAKLSNDMKEIVDLYSESMLSTKKDEATIDDLKARIKLLKKENEDLREEVAELKKKLSQYLYLRPFDSYTWNPFDPINPFAPTCLVKDE